MPAVLKHDFIATKQARYMDDLKTNLRDGELLVTLDFSENYAFHMQNEIRAQHWSKDQATLHVYVVYYKEKGKIKHLNCVVLSEDMTHDATSVHLFNKKLISFLKRKFNGKVTKLFYFSDGAGSQYKNKYNFVNLVNHKTDFNVDAEWHFFATSHGKGACDGVGGTVKRTAFRYNLQHDAASQITSTRRLYEWARSNFKNIHFDFCSKDDHKIHKESIQRRYENAQTIQQTRQYHSHKPLNTYQLSAAHISDDKKRKIVTLQKKKTRIEKYNDL